jgi:predicted  nucleic acid-binding Zn-ribbon protein
MLHEIEAVERDIRGREDLVLAEMEKAETLTGDVKREEQVFRSAEEQARGQGRELDEQGGTLREQAARLTAERDRVAASLPEDVLALFQRVARRRGTGVAEARDENCTECHVRLRVQMFVELKRNDQVMQCPACSRILFFVPVAAAAQP